MTKRKTVSFDQYVRSETVFDFQAMTNRMHYLLANHDGKTVVEKFYIGKSQRLNVVRLQDSELKSALASHMRIDINKIDISLSIPTRVRRGYIEVVITP